MSKSKSRTCSCCKALLAVVTLVCLTLPTARGQVSTGTFTGTVADPSGAFIPGATVTVTNEGTNVSVSRQTGADGIFTITDLPAGYYTLKAEASGFRALLNKHVELTVGFTQRIDFHLQVGAVTDYVTVEGEASPVDTETARMSE